MKYETIYRFGRFTIGRAAEDDGKWAWGLYLQPHKGDLFIGRVGLRWDR